MRSSIISLSAPDLSRSIISFSNRSSDAPEKIVLFCAMPASFFLYLPGIDIHPSPVWDCLPVRGTQAGKAENRMLTDIPLKSLLSRINFNDIEMSWNHHKSIWQIFIFSAFHYYMNCCEL
jgi:hypothetical protein